VWVIAETKDASHPLRPHGRDDDQGRYVVPDLPKAKYKVWVRGYGLVDSPWRTASPAGARSARVPAPNEAAAAQYYPAIYWYSMLKIRAPISSAATAIFRPRSSRSTGSTGQEQRLRRLPSARATGDGTIPSAFGDMKSSEEAWSRRIQSDRRRADGEHRGRPARGRPVQVFRRLDRIASPRASCPCKPPAAGASSATSWSPPGTGATRSIISTMRSRPTGAIPRLMPMGRCSARPNIPPTCFRSSIRRPIRDDVSGAGARCGYAEGLGPGHARWRRARALGLLGQREDLGHQGQQPQFDDRP